MQIRYKSLYSFASNSQFTCKFVLPHLMGANTQLRKQYHDSSKRYIHWWANV